MDSTTESRYRYALGYRFDVQRIRAEPAAYASEPRAFALDVPILPPKFSLSATW